MNGERCFARAGNDCYTHWKAGNRNRVCLLSNVSFQAPKFKQGSGILTFSPSSICQAVYQPDPKEHLLCVLCATCTVSHLSPLKNDREQFHLTGSSLDLCSTVSGSSFGRDPLEMMLIYPSCGFAFSVPLLRLRASSWD